MNTLHTRKSPDQVRQILALFVVSMKGHQDATGLLEGFKLRLGFGLLSCFYQAYLTKAKGGTDEAGIRWKELTKKYIAYGRLHPGLNDKRKQAAAEGRPGRPLLTKELDALWRRVYAQKYWEFSNGSSAEGHDAKGHAAAYAWTIVKAAGGQTIIGTYGDTPVEIGRNTGRALNAMAMAVQSSTNNDGCEIRPEIAAVLVAMTVSYMVHFHKTRPLWDGTRPFPREYRDVLDDITSSFFSQALPRLLSQ